MTESVGVPVAPLTRAQVDRCIAELRQDFDKAEVVYRSTDRILLRWHGQSSGRSTIVKLWSRPDLKGRIRRVLHLAACDHERRSMLRLLKIGMAVPYPFATGRLAPPLAGYTDVLFMEDLGPCESATEYFKRLITEGREADARRFEDAMIQMTEQIVMAGMLDYDHGFVNTVVQVSGRAVRLDFEFARWVGWPRLFTSLYGRMLGHVILLHAFAVQPDTERSRHFAARLRERLRPSPRVLARVSGYVQKWLGDQRDRRGIDTRLSLPWD